VKDLKATTALQQTIAVLNALHVYDLEQERFAGMPDHRFNQPPFFYGLDRRHGDGTMRRTSSSGVVISSDQSGTHIDALCHQAEDLTMFGGVRVDNSTETRTGYTKLGAETIAPIVARGVLLDVAAHRGAVRLPPREPITASDLRAVAHAQGTRIKRGDVLLVRTGYGAHWRDPDIYRTAAGLAADGSAWVAEHGVGVVGADNSGWDISDKLDEDMQVTLPGHVLLLIRQGVYFLENLNLEGLSAAHCHEFVFVGAPLKIVGATGAPLRPLALA
jgi:kynurenine formamidase